MEQDGAESIVAGGYTLERELGRGGMATVYLAKDRKHNRRVAVKVLHPELAAVLGTERFLQEIRVIATLQHPHIVGLIDSGVFGPEAAALAGRPFYVMPYLDGESLRQRLAREGQLPVADAVRLATDVASALDYAHRQGVIHRDIKPENILLHEGSALVADFGIALAVQQAGGERMTQTGLSLGTPHYMSPEQAMGERTITARSDVYALGAVTYEMLAGEPPFTGPTVQAIVARVMAEAPRSLTTARRSVPAHVEAAVLQALEKLPADRFASAAEFAAALTSRSFAPQPSSPTTGGPSSRLDPVSLIPWALLLPALGFIAFTTLRARPSGAPRPVQRFSILLPANGAWEDDFNSSVALSPDGSMLAYNGLDSTGRRLYLRAMDRIDPIPIPGSETAHFASFSPDSRWVGYVLNSHIVKARLAGGAPEVVCDVGGLSHWSWLEGDVMVFADGSGLKQCSTNGPATLLAASDTTEIFDFPHGLPGGRAVVFSVRRGGDSRLAALDLRTRTVKPLGLAGSDPRFVATGHLAFASAGGLVMAVPFDAEALEPRGEPAPVADGIRIDGQGRAFVAISRSGTIVAVPTSAFQRSLELVDRTGRAERLYARPGEFSDPRFSPDGRRVAVSLGDNIWQLDRDQGTLTRLSPEGGAERPAWSPDGRRVAYVRRFGPRNELRLTSADGGGQDETLLSVPGLEPWHVLFTPDSRSMLVRTVGKAGKRDILLVGLDSARRRVPLLATGANEVSPTLSPDGRWLAYASDESGRYEVYLRSFPDLGARRQVSLDGGSEPVWSPRGGELFFRNGPAMLASEVRGGATLEVVRRAELFSDGDYAVGATYQNYDVSPDGRHFLMIRHPEGPSHLMVTLYRFENLES